MTEKTYTNILVPISFDSDEKIDAAIATARRNAGTDADITLLHVMEAMPSQVISYLPEGFRADQKDAIVAASVPRT